MLKSQSILSDSMQNQFCANESHLSLFGQRITYTFLDGNELKSLHFDAVSGKFFYMGHRMLPETAMRMIPDPQALLNKFADAIAYADLSESLRRSFEDSRRALG